MRVVRYAFIIEDESKSYNGIQLQNLYGALCSVTISMSLHVLLNDKTPIDFKLMLSISPDNTPLLQSTIQSIDFQYSAWLVKDVTFDVQPI